MPSNKVTVTVRLRVKPKYSEPTSKSFSTDKSIKTYNVKQILAEGFIIFLIVGLIASILKGVGYPFFTDNWILVWVIVITLVIVRISLREGT